MSGFFSVYVLRSLSRLNACYVGFTTHPLRRIRQHNGELQAGAWRTRNCRPWEMAAVFHGFPNRISALQFEWALQHPEKSRLVRSRLSEISKKELGPKTKFWAKLRVAHEMLHLPPWYHLSLSCFYAKRDVYDWAALHCPSPPLHIKVSVADLVEIDIFRQNQRSISASSSGAHFSDSGDDDSARSSSGNEGNDGMLESEGSDDHDDNDSDNDIDNDDSYHNEADDDMFPSFPSAEATPDRISHGSDLGSQSRSDASFRGAAVCSICTCNRTKELIWKCQCGAQVHVVCLAQSSLNITSDPSLIPTRGFCPSCMYNDPWSILVASLRMEN
eukprot:ANDGO_05907.mRNA.1 Structure-specific endonuclease subunit SLX1